MLDTEIVTLNYTFLMPWLMCFVFIESMARFSSYIKSTGIADNANSISAEPEPSELTQSEQNDILIVEDNEFNQDLIKKQMLRLGHHVDLASDGRDAIRKWEQHQYLLILSDCHNYGGGNVR